jgi:hypothetical protein
MTKNHYLFGHIFNFYFITKFQNHRNEHDHGLLSIKDAYMYGMHTNEEIEWFVSSCIFFVMYHYYQIHCKIHNNINTHVHVRKKQCCL